MPKAQDAALAELAELGQSLGAAIEDQEKKRETLNKILGTIGALDPDDAKALFKNEKVQRLIELASSEIAETGDDPPGTVYSGIVGGQVVQGFVKKPWTESDLTKLIEAGKMQLVRNYLPVSSRLVGWNGLQRHFRARRRITVPECFVYVYEQSLNEEVLAEQHVAFLFRQSDTIVDSEGRPDWSVISENSVRTRGMGDGKGHYVPGGGMISMADREEGAG